MSKAKPTPSPYDLSAAAKDRKTLEKSRVKTSERSPYTLSHGSSLKVLRSKDK